MIGGLNLEEVIIVGGGAAGLMAGIIAARRGRKVTIIDHKDKIGKKILATGNGRCNYTNTFMDITCFNSDNIPFVEKVLDRFSYNETIEFFMSLGIYPKDINGYIYPNSLQALSVLKVLELESLHLGINIKCNISVEYIKKTNKGFVLQTNEGGHSCNKVILACGGCASAKLGSDGSGFDFARNLGHYIIKPLPGLVQLKSSEKFFKIVDGVRTDALISLYVSDQLICSQRGELQFTKYGVSGIPILQISRFASKALNSSKKVFLNIDLLPDSDWQATMDIIKSRISSNPYKTIEELFYGLFNNKLAKCILKRVNISGDMPCNKLEQEKLVELVNMIKNFNVKITDTNPFDNAQVTVGGVDTKNVNPSTMESKLVKDLYFCGEILDVDGTCGGYNLQWAWSSGYLAGMSV